MMGRQNKEIPVYVFMGFLESGKTTFAKETLMDRGFTGGARHFFSSVRTERRSMILRL